LVPENPLPTPIEECYKVTKYVMENANEFNVDPDRIALAGDSAGGNAVAVVTQRLLKEQLRQPKVYVHAITESVIKILNFPV
jgi:acetyl esterase/lipase